MSGIEGGIVIFKKRAPRIRSAQPVTRPEKINKFHNIADH